MTATRTVNLTPASYLFSLYSYPGAGQLTIPVGRSQPVQVYLDGNERIRGGLSSVTVPVVNSNVSAVKTSTLTLFPGDSFGSLTIAAQATGTAILTLPGIPSSILIVTVVPSQ